MIENSFYLNIRKTLRQQCQLKRKLYRHWHCFSGRAIAKKMFEQNLKLSLNYFNEKMFFLEFPKIEMGLELSFGMKRKVYEINMPSIQKQEISNKICHQDRLEGSFHSNDIKQAQLLFSGNSNIRNIPKTQPKN